MDKGTNFELHALIKFNMVPSPVSTYFITLDTVTRRPLQTFQERPPIIAPSYICMALVRNCLIGPQMMMRSMIYNAFPWWRDQSCDPLIGFTDLSNLEIVKVAIETRDGDVNERLKAKNAIFYIAFKGLATNIAFKGLATDGGLGEHDYGKHVVRKAIIKRSVHERTGNLSLLGDLDKEEEELNVMTWQEFHKQGLQNRKWMTCARKNKS
ncbi:unnamed protein product [Arabis nemorensis]|uniref:Uncharacterized protein n=1 Tax=Arabis nemorensis TaxID=586526 RepID=A0A565BQU5_9BRAS|nr:unnamed protein product [Arabis nemorensis]